jgi:excisionase family DNA binding protein
MMGVVEKCVRREESMVEDLGDRWLTVDDIADRLQVSHETVRRWIRSGKLSVLDLGGPKAGYRVKPEELQRFIEERYGPVTKTAA